MIREEIRKIIRNAIKKTDELNTIDKELDFTVERPRKKEHGDWATNIAMISAPMLKKNPRLIAELISQSLDDKNIEKTEVAGPGFINIFFKKEWYYEVLKKIEAQDIKYGQIDYGKNMKVLLEYVSANPVGPLHIGHGRWAAIGDTLARVLKKASYKVTTEFYVNDYGRQTKLFAESLEPSLGPGEIPKEGYRGKYVADIARKLVDKHGEEIFHDTEKLKKEAVNSQLKNIKSTLDAIGVNFDLWPKESSLYADNKVDQTIKELDNKSFTYEEKGAVWLKTSAFGDEKDRVLIRSNGEPTYFVADIAYHKDKIERGFDILINIWGADHHGYIARVKASIEALGEDPKILKIVLGQLVNLIKDGKPVKMSKRTGELITLDELIEEVGVDAIRYTFLTKSTDTTLDFDIDLVKEQSDKNPVFYVQYAHARISSIIRFAESKGIKYKDINSVNLEKLTEEVEIDLIRTMEEFEEIVEVVARNLTPHLLTIYAKKLSSVFHSFYTVAKVVNENDDELTQARLALLNAAHITLRNVLELLGVSAPTKM